METIHYRIKKRILEIGTRIEIIPVTQDTYGDVVEGIPVEHPCYIERKNKIVRNREGTEVTSVAQFYLSGYIVPGYHDLVSFEGRKYPIVSFSPYHGIGSDVGVTAVYI